MVFKTFKSCSVRSSKTNTCRNNLFACRFACSRGHSCMRMRWLTSTKTMVISRLFLRWRSRKGFQSVICFKYSEKQIGFSHRNLYNFHLLSNSSPAKTSLSTRNRISPSTSIPLWCHFDGRSSWESKEPRFRLLEIEAKCGDIHTSKIFSNKPGFWRREPRLVTYATEISLLRSLVASQ